MNKYNADRTPDAQEWLAADEGERLSAVESYHRRIRAELPNARLHAVIHTIVENQLAMAEPAVVETFERLQREGLNRHETIHAIGMVLSDSMIDLVNDPPADPAKDAPAAYAEKLRRITAEEWRNAG